MLFNFYYNSKLWVSFISMYTIIALLIGIIVINVKILNAVNDNDENSFKKYLKIQKILIWINYSINVFLFLFLLSVSIYLFKPRFQPINDRRKHLSIVNILSLCLIIVFTGLTYYNNKSINEMNMLNAKEEIKKILIIVPVISIITLSLLMYNFSYISMALQYMSNYFTEWQFENLSQTITRNNSPSYEDEYIPSCYRENL